MKNYLSIASLVLSVLIGIMVYTNKNNTRKFAYVNTGKLLSEYEGMKVANKEIQKETATWKANIDTLGKEFERDLKKFEKNRATMSKNEIKLSEELLQRKQQDYYKYQQAVEKKIKEADQKSKLKVAEEMSKYIKEYGKSHDYEYIFGANQLGNILYADESKEITEDVLKELNKNYNSDK